jgi:hypothetical protein
MLDLSDSCSLDVSFDVANNKIIYGEKICHPNLLRVPLEKLVPTLLNKSLSYPEEVYEEHINVFHQEDQQLGNSQVSYDFICLPAGLLGIEFVKTHIYFAPESSTGKFSSAVEVHYGILTIIMQKNAPKGELDFETNVEEGMIVKVRRGEKFFIPQGYLYTFINTEECPVLFVRIYRNIGILDYKMLRRERGLAYYCIRKNARQEIVLNPLYRNTPHIEEMDVDDFDFDLKFDNKKPLYQMLRKDMTRVRDSLWA